MKRTCILICLLLLLINNPSVANFALEFDRAQHYEVTVPNSESTDIDDASITIECWINVPDPGDAPASIIASKFGAWRIRVDPSGQFQIRPMINGQNAGWFGTGRIEANTWTHVAATYDGENIRTYVDGEEITSENLEGDIDSTGDPVRFGRREHITSNFYSGILDEFRLWDVVRTGDEIQNNMNRLLSGNEEGLMGYWRFDEGEGQVAHDLTEFENHGRLGAEDGEDQRDPPWVESEAPVYGGVIEISHRSIYFGPVPVNTEKVFRFYAVNQSDEDDIDFRFFEIDENPEWLDFPLDEFTIEPGDTLEIQFSANTEDLDLGEYEHSVLLSCNAMNLLDLEIPITMTAVGGVGTINGHVTNEQTGDPIQWALVKVLADFHNQRFTDIDGYFEFIGIPAFDYSFRVTADDFLPQISEEFNLEADEEIEIEFQMLHSEFDSDPVGFNLAMQSNDTLTLPLSIENFGNGPLTWNAEILFPEGANIDPWAPRWDFRIQELLNNSRLGGVEFVRDSFFVAGGVIDDQNLIYVLDSEGELGRTFPQHGESNYGYRGLCWDSELLWGYDGNIHGFNLDGELIEEFESPINPARGITWDPDLEVLWVTYLSNRIYGIRRDGEVQFELDRPGDLRIYGLGYFPNDPDGYNLYCFTGNGDNRREFHKLDIETGETMFLNEPELDCTAGSMNLSGIWDPYSWVIISIVNSNSDLIQIWQLDARNEWINISPTEGVVEANGNNSISVAFDTFGLPEENEFEADIEFLHDGEGGRNIVPIALTITGEGGISRRNTRLNLGWNLVSANVQPNIEEFSFEDVVAPLVDADILMLAKDHEGNFYYPQLGFNQIENWDGLQGYYLKVARPTEIVISGEVIVTDMEIPLSEGWNLVSYLPRRSIDPRFALSGLGENLDMVKDGEGRFYIPAWDFSCMNTMMEGSGYLIKVDEETDLVYQQENLASRELSDYNESPWIEPEFNTGSNMSLLVKADPSEIGNNIQAVTSGGLIAGQGVVSANGYAALALWGDDPSTSNIEGFVDGEAISLELVFSQTSGFVDFTTLAGKTEQWTDNGWGVVQISSSTVPGTFELISAYPNPFNSSINIKYGLYQTTDVSLKIFDISGREVYSMANKSQKTGVHTVSWDGTLFSTGMYFLKIESIDNVEVQKLLLLK